MADAPLRTESYRLHQKLIAEGYRAPDGMTLCQHASRPDDGYLLQFLFWVVNAADLEQEQFARQTQYAELDPLSWDDPIMRDVAAQDTADAAALAYDARYGISIVREEG